MVLIETMACLLWLLLLLTERHNSYMPYPGTRALCRLLFLGSASIAVPLSVSVGLAGIAFGEPLIANLNRVFVVGILGQTLSWMCLFRRGLRYPPLGPWASRVSQPSERELILLVAGITDILHNSCGCVLGGVYGSHEASH
jgi:hypothetical protein